jgi:hypothetical protein
MVMDEIAKNKIKKIIKHINRSIKSREIKLDKRIRLNKMPMDKIIKKAKLQTALKTK